MVDTTTVREMLRIVGTVPVLSWIEEDGYPASSRVTLGLDAGGGLIIVPPGGLELRPGTASLMAHFHNERMWKMKAVLFRGELAQSDGQWVFTATKQVGKPDMGALEGMKMVGGAKKAASRYLAKRGLERPDIPWADIVALKKEAKKLGIN